MADWTEEFKRKLKTISCEFKEAQQLLVDNGVDIYHPDIALGKWEKIQIPKGHIRTVETFRKKYFLSEILDDKILSKNLAYSLQASDLMNLLFNRVNIDLSVGRVFYKMAIINHFSIIEGMLFGVAKKLHGFCRSNENGCSYQRNCKHFIKSHKKQKIDELIEWFCEKKIINLSAEEKEILSEVKGMRNNVHIWLAEKNEFLKGEYNLTTHNRTVLVLQKCRDELAENLPEFERNRSAVCMKINTSI